MSKTTKAILVKFVMTFILGWFTLGAIDGNYLGWILFFAVLVTTINYIIGDFMVLPSFGNIIASIGDGFMGAAIAYIIDIFSFNFTTSLPALTVLAVLIAMGEYFFHIYLNSSDKVAP